MRFGAVMRAHPASDKLARTRLELLILALPFGCGLMVSESRIHWIGRSRRDDLYGYFISRVGRYSKRSESKSPDQFRRDVVKHLDEMARPHRAGKRIDGLTWVISQGAWYVCDDFGYELTCEQQEGGDFRGQRSWPRAVTGREPSGPFENCARLPSRSSIPAYT